MKTPTGELSAATTPDTLARDPSRGGDSSTTGRVVSHYRVEERLGVGGMGEVYRARDLALDRMVALKLLPADFSAPLRARLLREAWASARLQHPCIATFYEGGEDGETAFIAMEYVAGKTLRAQLKTGPLMPAQALAILAGLLEALAHAHSAGLVHRDIKPENIMLTGERSGKLLDFGLAKPARSEELNKVPPIDHSAGERHLAATSSLDLTIISSTASRGLDLSSSDLTAPQTIVGTFGYMAPEQLHGARVDARSDLFVLAAVLFEMLTGKPAFPGKTVRERFDATLNWRRELLDEGVPAIARALLQRAMAPAPEDRYPTAGAFLRDVRALASETLRLTVSETIAVADLAVISDQPSDEWLGGALGEGIARHLRELPGITLFPRERLLSERRNFAGTEIELGLRLGCRWLVTGAVHRTAEELQATVRLVDLPTGGDAANVIAADTTREFLNLQTTVARKLAQSLNQELPSLAQETRNNQAYESCTRAIRLVRNAQKQSLETAEELLQDAVRLDPHYAQAFAWLAACQALRYPYTTDGAALDSARRLAEHAIELNPNSSVAYIWLGYCHNQARNYAEGHRALRRATELNPSEPIAWYFLNSVSPGVLRTDPARALAAQMSGQQFVEDGHRELRERIVAAQQRAVSLDPAFGMAWLYLGAAHLDLGRSREAIWCLGRAALLEQQGAPVAAGATGCLVEALRRAGQLDEARHTAAKALLLLDRTDHIYRDTYRGVCLCACGRTALQQHDRPAAEAAFNQALQLMRGRSRARGGGHLLVQSLAGLAQTRVDPAPYREALAIFRDATLANFAQFLFCSHDITLFSLALAAHALHLPEAQQLLIEARDYGATESWNP